MTLCFGKAGCHRSLGHPAYGFVSGNGMGFSADCCLWLTVFCHGSLQNSYELSGTLGYLFRPLPLPSLPCFSSSCSCVLAEIRNTASEAIL